MFLTVLVPGPTNPKGKIDVFLQPLIAELKSLHAALMWTINDFPVYSMMSGWSIAGMLACPHCMEDSDAFRYFLCFPFFSCFSKQIFFLLKYKENI